MEAREAGGERRIGAGLLLVTVWCMQQQALAQTLARSLDAPLPGRLFWWGCKQQLHLRRPVWQVQCMLSRWLQSALCHLCFVPACTSLVGAFLCCSVDYCTALYTPEHEHFPRCQCIRRALVRVGPLSGRTLRPPVLCPSRGPATGLPLTRRLPCVRTRSSLLLVTALL